MKIVDPATPVEPKTDPCVATIAFGYVPVADDATNSPVDAMDSAAEISDGMLPTVAVAGRYICPHHC